MNCCGAYNLPRGQVLAFVGLPEAAAAAVKACGFDAAACWQGPCVCRPSLDAWRDAKGGPPDSGGGDGASAGAVQQQSLPQPPLQ